MGINILDSNVVKLIVQDIESQQNLERKRQEWVAYQCTQGMLREYVREQLRKLFPLNGDKMRVSDISISKKVVDKVADAYCEAPIRTIPEGSDVQKKELQQIYKKGKFNGSFQDYDEIFNLHRHGLFWCDYDYVKKSFRPMALRPYEYDLVRDSNTGEVLCVILNYPDLEITQRQLEADANPGSISDGVNQLITESQYDSGTQSKVYALWTPTNHVVVVVAKKEITLADGKTDINYAVTYVPINGNPASVNPLGRLPFVYKQKGSSVDYPTFNQLTEQTINFNILNSDLLTAATVQGFGQAVLSYPDNAEIKQLEIGYMSAVKLPQSTEPNAPKTEFKFENPSPDLAGQQKTYLSYLKQVLSEHGITSSQSIDGENEQFTSGLDRMIANADVNKIIYKNQETYKEIENEVFDIIKTYYKILGNNIFNNVEELMIYFPKATVQITESDVIKNVVSLLDAGLITKAKALMKLNPNLTEQQAQDELNSINEEKSALVESMNTQDPNDNTNGDTSTNPPVEDNNPPPAAGNKPPPMQGSANQNNQPTYSN